VRASRQQLVADHLSWPAEILGVTDLNGTPCTFYMSINLLWASHAGDDDSAAQTDNDPDDNTTNESDFPHHRSYLASNFFFATSIAPV